MKYKIICVHLRLIITACTSLEWELLYPMVGQMSKASPEVMLKLQARLNQLLEADWQDTQKQIYPASLLFDHPS